MRPTIGARPTPRTPGPADTCRRGSAPRRGPTEPFHWSNTRDRRFWFRNVPERRGPLPNDACTVPWRDRAIAARRRGQPNQGSGPRCRDTADNLARLLPPRKFAEKPRVQKNPSCDRSQIDFSSESSVAKNERIPTKSRPSCAVAAWQDGELTTLSCSYKVYVQSRGARSQRAPHRMRRTGGG